MRTLRIPEKWRFHGVPLHQLELPDGVMIGLIHRRTDGFVKTIFPHGGDALLPGDEATFIGETGVVSNIHQFLGQAPLWRSLLSWWEEP